MANPTLCVCDETTESLVCDKVQILDTARAPFNTFVKHLTQISESGLWLNPFRGIPQMPGLPAIGILLLDSELAVVECVPELPESGLSDTNPSVKSALVVPASTIAALEIRARDQFRICDSETRSGWDLGNGEPEASLDPCQCFREDREPGQKRTAMVHAAITKMKAEEEAAHVSNKPEKPRPFRERVISWMTGFDEGAERRRSPRIRYPKLVAYYWTGGSPKAFRIGDIGPTGFYLITEDRWIVGTRILMTLQRTEAEVENSESQITVPVTVVRAGHDGVGFEFVTSAAIDPDSGRVVPSSRQSKERLTRFLESSKLK